MLKVSTEDGNLKLQWDDAWATWGDLQQSPELQAILDKSKGILDKRGKGAGKSKAGGAAAFEIGTTPPETKCFTVANPWCTNQF